MPLVGGKAVMIPGQNEVWMKDLGKEGQEKIATILRRTIRRAALEKLISTLDASPEDKQFYLLWMVGFANDTNVVGIGDHIVPVLDIFLAQDKVNLTDTEKEEMKLLSQKFFSGKKR